MLSRRFGSFLKALFVARKLHFQLEHAVGKFCEAIAGAHGFHDQPDEQRGGRSEHYQNQQDDQCHFIHSFTLSLTGMSGRRAQ